MKSNRFLIGQLATDYVSGRYTPDDELDAKIADLQKKSLEPIGTTDSAVIDVTDAYTNQLDGDPSFNSVSLIVNGEGTYSQKVEGSRYAAPLTFNGECRPASSAPVYRGRYSWRTPDSSYNTNHVTVTQQNSCFPIANGNWTFEFWVRFNYFFNDSVRWFDTGGNGDAGAIVFGTGSTGSIGWGRPTSGTGVGTATGVIKMGQWHHVVFTSEAGGTNGRTFVDGVLQAGPVGYTNMTANDRSMRIGNQNVHPTWSVPDMQLADFRFFNENVFPYGPNVATVGTKYFTPDPKPPQTDMVTWDGGRTYKRVDSCQLHTFADPYLIDRSKNNLSCVQSGTSPYITDESPYTEMYDETPTSHSVYFDGTGDYLTVSSSAEFAFDGDFTIEHFAYFTDLSVQKNIWDMRVSTGNETKLATYFDVATGKYKLYVDAQDKIVSTETITTNVWYHFALVRNNGVITLYVNGTASGSTWTTSASFGNAPVKIGARYDNANSVLGYLSNFRVIKGTAVYTADFDDNLPTAPFTAVSGTSLLTCQDNSFVDNSDNAFEITVSGNAIAKPFNPYDTVGPYWSTKHDGNNDYVTFPSSEDFNLGTNDLTIEFWARALWPNQDVTRKISANYNAWAANAIFIGRNAGAGVDGRMSVWINNYSASASFLTDPNFMTEDWHHYAIVRNGNDWTLYRDGVSVATRTWSGSANSAAGVWYVGGSGESSGTLAWWGNISNYRIVKGTALYTTNFTPSTQPLTAIPNTVLLTAQNRMFKDNSASNHSPTVIGDAKTSVVSPFTELGVNSYYRTMEAVEKDTSGSIFFDGSGDYISITDRSSTHLSSSDFTIEGWIHPVVLSGSQNVIGDADNGYGSFLIHHINGNQLVFYSSTTGSSWNLASAVNIGSTVINRWYHFAVTREGSTFRTFLNGVQGATFENSTAMWNSGKRITIGSNGATQYWNGYISNIRIIRGRALYRGNFTPPTRLLEATDDTVLLACNSKYGWTNFHPVDEVGGRPSYVNRQTGDPKLSNFSPLAPVGWSTYFDGTGDELETASAIVSSTEYSIEAWVYAIGNTQGYIAAQYTAGNGNRTVFLYRETTGVLYFFHPNRSSYAAGTLNLNTWYHVAITRDSGGTTRIFVDGILKATFTTAYTPEASSFSIGGNGEAGSNFNGYISNMRVLNGAIPVDYQTSSTTIDAQIFTPPTQPLTAIPGTQLLTCQDQMLTDYSPNDFFVTRNGDVKTVPFSPLSGTVVPKTYSTYFDGTGDYIQMPAGAYWNFGTGAFTFEMWVYPESDEDDVYNLFSINQNGSNQWTWAVTTGSNWGMYFYWGNYGSNQTERYTGQYPIKGQWNHVVVSRDTDYTWRFYLNGTLIPSSIFQQNTSWSDSRDLNNTSITPRIGEGLKGYISDVRITKGAALYNTSTINLPIAPVTAVSGTQLLTCQSSYNVDNSDNNLDITGSGNPKILTHNPFGYDINEQFESYDPEIHGGSTYLDGNDYWHINQTERNLTMYFGDWTWELWVNPATSSSTIQTAFYIYGNTIDSTSIWYISGTGQVNAGYRSTSQASVTLTGNATGAARPGQWTHVAFERQGTALRLYVNGRIEATATIAAAASMNEFQDNWFHQPRIGAASNSDKYFVNGNIGPFRITKRALYKGVGFVPGLDTATLKPDTVSLIKWGTSAIQSETGRNMIQVVGDIRPVDVPIDQGPGSVYFDGSGDYLTAPATSEIIVDRTGDFTIECWAYTTSSSDQTLFYFNGNSSSYGACRVGFNTNKVYLLVSTTGSSWQINSGNIGTINSNEWYHIAVARNGNNFTLYVNGTSIYNSTSVTSATQLMTGTYNWIGARFNSGVGNLFNGSISNLRAVKGTAVYTSNFTPPTAPLAAISGTSLLTCNGSLNDSSKINNTITVFGDARISNFSPTYKPMTAETNSAYYFDGSGDYLSIAYSPAFLMGSSEDFCMEGWVNPSVSPANTSTLYSSYDGATVGNWIIWFQSGKLGVYQYNDSNFTTGAFQSTTTIPVGSWTHFAFTRSGTVFRLFINGVQEDTFTGSVTFGVANKSVEIGRYSAGASSYFNGYIDDLRITKGVARYTSNFVPSPFPLKLRLPDPLSHKRRISKPFTDAVTEVISGPYPIERYTYSGQTATFSATGSDQTWVVPNDVYLITAKLWGAGGGNRSTAGAGGYTEAEISVTPGETITVMVGSDGSDSGGVTSDSYGGGGGAYSDNGNGGRQGGGRSALRSGGVDILTAGGGGGSGFNHGGYGGGGLTGRTGGGVAGSGGTQTAGGAGGGGNGGTAEAGVQYTGGISTPSYAGGGGGGGWFGGGGGSGVVNNHGGGGGGSGFVGRDGSTALTGDEWGSPTEYGDNVPRPFPTDPLDLSGYRYDEINGRYYNYAKCLRGNNASSTAIMDNDSQYPGSVGGASQPGYIVINY